MNRKALVMIPCEEKSFIKFFLVNLYQRSGFRMKFTFKAIFLLLLVFYVSSCQKQDFDFYDLEGKGYSYSDLEGRYQIVNYWAIWCAPCKLEIPELQALHDEYDNVSVFGVNFDQPEPQVMSEQVKMMKIGFPTYREDPSTVFGINRPEVLPTTLVFGPDRELLATLVGPQTKKSLLAIIQEN